MRYLRYRNLPQPGLVYDSEEICLDLQISIFSLAGCPLQGNFVEKNSLQGKIREFGKNGKNLGILQKHVREISRYFQTVS